MKRRDKIFLLAVAAAIVLGWLLAPSGSSRRAVEAYKAQLIAKGEKLTMVELAPTTTPEGIAAGKRFLNLTNMARRATNTPPLMKMVAPGVAIADYSQLEPAQMASYAPNSARTAELGQILNSPALDFAPDYSMGYEMSIPHLAPIKAASQLLSTTSLQALHEGDHPAAWSNLIAGINLVKLFRTEPILISFIVRSSVAQISIATSWVMLQQPQWSDAQLADLQARWEAVNFTNEMDSVVAMERAFEIDALARFRKKDYVPRMGDLDAAMIAGVAGLPAVADDDDTFYEKMKRKLTYLYDRNVSFRVWQSSWSYNEELSTIQTSTAALEIVRHISENGAFSPGIRELQTRSVNVAQVRSADWSHFRALIDYAPGFHAYLSGVAKGESARRLLIVAIALKRFQLRHGTYPASLNELAPEFLKQVPADPWDGKPLRYQLKPDGTFLLYSIGEDGEDNGGDATTPGTMNDWTRGRDMVWPRAATPAEIENYRRDLTNKVSANKVVPK